MEKNKINTENNKNTKFAFLPEVVLEHLNDAKTTAPKEIIKEEIPNPEKSQAIIFDPMADPFDGIHIEIESTIKKKSKIRSIKTIDNPNSETPTLIIAENKIMQLVKKIKFYFINF